MNSFKNFHVVIAVLNRGTKAPVILRRPLPNGDVRLVPFVLDSVFEARDEQEAIALAYEWVEGEYSESVLADSPDYILGEVVSIERVVDEEQAAA